MLNSRNKEEKRFIEQEEQQKAFHRERDVFHAGTRDDTDVQMFQETRSDLLRWQQDLNDEKDKLINALRSNVFDHEVGDWVPKAIVRIEGNKQIQERVKPLANEQFIDYVATQVEPFLSRNMINSNFDEKRALQILEDTSNDICNSIAEGWDCFEIEFRNYDAVVRLIKNVIIPAPFRAINDGQRRHDRSINRRIEAFNEGIKPAKKGLFGGTK